ncbi:MAG: hypothetical protein JW731_06815, partial [Bacteroidales bacterium]|nr:hypothetical protein [Bacteroidales bacterium]
FRNNLSGIQYGVAEIMDYPVIYDDQMFFSYDLTSSIPVLCIHETENNPYLNALFMSDSIFQITNSYERQLDYSTLSTYPVIILDGLSHISSGLREELTKVIQQGGNLILFPSGRPEMDSYDSFFQTINSPAFGNPDTTFLRVDYIATESPVLAEMFDRRSDGSVILPEHADLPGVFFHFPVIRKNQSGIEELLSLQNGQPFLFSLPVGKGFVYVFTTPLDLTKTNFPKHLLFVPVLFQIALNSQHLQPIYYYSGMDDPIIFGKDSTSEKSLYKIRKNDSDFEMIPEKCQKNGHFCLFPHGQIQESGLYHIDNEYITMHGLGFNYHRNESDLTFETIQTLEEMLEKIHMNHYEILKDTPASLTTEIIRLQHGTPLWKLFLIISLTFFAFEIIAILLFRKRS